MRGCSCRGTAGFAHVSCLAEQAKILVAEAEENNKDSQWHRWFKCSLCEQEYHGVVHCALAWACWKTYVGRAETDSTRLYAMTQLGNGLCDAGHHEDALSVQEAELAIKRRLGASEDSENILAVQSNLAMTYRALGRDEEALQLRRDAYSRRLKLNGEEHVDSLMAALNYASSLENLGRFEEAKSLLRKTMPVARRVLGESQELTLRMRFNYAMALYLDPSATLGNLREAVNTLDNTDRTARRVFGGAHPLVVAIEQSLPRPRASPRPRGDHRAWRLRHGRAHSRKAMSS